MSDLCLTILYVRDLREATAFYDTAFGWEKTIELPVYVEYRVAGPARIGLMPQQNIAEFAGAELGAKRPTDGCPRAEIYVHVKDVEATAHKLTHLGARCTSTLASRDWGDRAAYFLDPNGYILVIATPDAAPGRDSSH